LKPLQVSDQVRQFRVYEPTKFRTPSRRVRQRIPTRIQEPCSMNFRCRPRAAKGVSVELTRLRTKEVRADGWTLGRALVPVTPHQFARLEHDAPPAIQHTRPVPRVVQH